MLINIICALACSDFPSSSIPRFVQIAEREGGGNKGGREGRRERERGERE